MKIKICGLKDSANINEVKRLCPDYTGYIFYRNSSRYAGNILLPESEDSTKRIGVFVNERVEEILRVSRLNGLDYIQLHGNESPDYCRFLSEKGMKIIKAFAIGSVFNDSILSHYSPVCSYFLFDTKGKLHGGNGKKFNWKILTGISAGLPFFLSGGIGPEDAEAVCEISERLPNLHAVDINSRFEVAPGVKDISLLQNFIHQIKNKQHAG